MSVLDRSSTKYLLFVLVTSVLFRTAFLLWSWSGSTFLMSPSVLSTNYFKEGYAIAAGYGYVVGNSPSGVAAIDELYQRVTVDRENVTPENTRPVSYKDLQPQVLHPPGLPILIALAHRSFGGPSDVPVQLVGLMLDTAAALIFAWIVTKTFGARIGLIAGLLYALFPPFAYYAISNESDGLVGFFVVASVACSLQAIGTERRLGMSWAVLAGVCLGVGGYVRPDYILLPGLMFFGLWAYTGALWQSLKLAAVVQAVTLSLLLPWAFRNYGVCGRWIFTSTSVGGTIVTGLGSFQNPWGLGGTDEHRTREALAQGISSPWSCEGDLYFRAVFFRSVQQHPSGYVTSVAKRIPLILATPYGFGFQSPFKMQTFSEAREQGEDRYQVLLRRPSYVLLAYWDYLAMAAVTAICWIATLLMMVRQRSKLGLILLLISPHLYSTITHALTHMEPRYILPSMFCLLLGPAYLLNQLAVRSSAVPGRTGTQNSKLWPDQA